MNRKACLLLIAFSALSFPRSLLASERVNDFETARLRNLETGPFDDLAGDSW